ncbi:MULTISPECIES: hypothetical protein [unclassified Duganella]|uniref:hypothetical protein n=1 Tax=unclassified Duganella TaxID=2636909 RepID=UPI00088E5864|nr:MULTISPECIES: hypothetical protein [unclassified Duganella]SDH05376.1 hypothetical protein SAMN05216320_109123 [Duganella sp. OV458]SDK20794.1 hypothetical protein SAMN05428973_109159 [Duganella sp. OV510]
MNAFKNHTNVSTSPVSAQLVIRNLISELTASDEVIRTLHRFMPAHQLVHAKLELQGRGVVDQNLQRLNERAAVVALATSFLADLPTIPAASLNLVKRLRTVAGQSIVKPPALDLEAADHIERLEARLALQQQSPELVLALQDIIRNVREEQYAWRVANDALKSLRLPDRVKFVQVTSHPEFIRPDLGDRRFWPVDLPSQELTTHAPNADQELVSILEGALADDLVQYHSQEWLARARAAIVKHRSPDTAGAGHQSEIERLRREQTADVMRLIGPLLDAFDGTQKKDLADVAPGLASQLVAINQAMEGRRPSAVGAHEQVAGGKAWRDGALMALSVLVSVHDQPTMAASVVNELSLCEADCSELDEFDKTNLRKIQKAGRGMKLRGLDINAATQEAQKGGA